MNLVEGCGLYIPYKLFEAKHALLFVSSQHNAWSNGRLHNVANNILFIWFNIDFGDPYPEQYGKKASIKSQFFFFIMNELLKIVFCFVSIPHIHYNFGFIPFCLKEKIMEIKKQLGKIDNKFVQVMVKWLYN